MNTEERVENAVEWIDALCVNDWKQHTGAMNGGPGSHCCLGVARKVCEFEGTNISFLIGVERDALGLHHTDGSTPLTGLMGLASMNDGGRSHQYIVRMMLRNLKAYFKADVADGIAEHYWGDV